MFTGVLMMGAGYYVIWAKQYVLSALGMEDIKDEYNFWVYMVQLACIIWAYIWPIVKLILYLYLDLPWFGTDFDLIADLI